jgi:hypothetical protein
MPSVISIKVILGLLSSKPQALSQALALAQQYAITCAQELKRAGVTGLVLM